jgi:hypothetical protein
LLKNMNYGLPTSTIDELIDILNFVTKAAVHSLEFSSLDL